MKLTDKQCVLLLLCSLLLFSSRAVATQPSPEELEHYRELSMIALFDEQLGEYDGAQYAIIRDMIIPPGESLVLYPGCKVFLARDVKIVIKGRLVLNGNPDLPVEFQPLDRGSYFLKPDSLLSPAWRGIVIEKSGTLNIRHATLRGSEYGVIASVGYSELILDSAVFSDHSQGALTVLGTRLNIKNGFLVSGVVRGDVPEISQDLPSEIRKERRRRFRVCVSLSSTGVALAACGGATYFFLKGRTLDQDAYKSGNSQTQTQWNNATNAYQKANLLTIVSVVSGCGALSLSLPLLWDNQEK